MITQYFHMPQQAFEVFYLTISPTGSVQVTQKYVLYLTHVRVLYMTGSPVQFLHVKHISSQSA